MVRKCVLAAVLLLSGQTADYAATADVPVTACPSFDALAVKLDRRIADLKPGLGLEEFTKEFAQQALNFEHPQSAKGALFIVAVSESSATVTDELQCRFDAKNKLVGCKRECCRYRIRSITLEQYNSLVIGESRADVERRLCSPSLVERPRTSRVNTYYHIPVPIWHHDEGQAVLLVFDHGRLRSKDMSPYY